MIPSVGTQVLPHLIVCRPWATTVPQHAFYKIAQISPAIKRYDVVSDIPADIGEDKRNTINNGEFVKTLFIGAVQTAFDDMAVLLACYVRDA
jgi:hypothetical protein